MSKMQESQNLPAFLLFNEWVYFENRLNKKQTYKGKVKNGANIIKARIGPTFWAAGSNELITAYPKR